MAVPGSYLAGTMTLLKEEPAKKAVSHWNNVTCGVQSLFWYSLCSSDSHYHIPVSDECRLKYKTLVTFLFCGNSFKWIAYILFAMHRNQKGFLNILLQKT